MRCARCSFFSLPAILVTTAASKEQQPARSKPMSLFPAGQPALPALDLIAAEQTVWAAIVRTHSA